MTSASRFPNPEDLASVATGRTDDLFRADLEARSGEVREKVEGRRILVVGGAGSIGTATVEELTAFRPQTLHVVDQNENSLAELVRHLRSRTQGLSVPDFRALPLDFGSTILQRFLQDERAYDLVLNFAAIKHVRSEKDVPSLLHLLDTNLVKAARLLGWLREKPPQLGYFCVSTDKAANPVNLMGASKRIMERGALGGGLPFRTSSARFANVAFSDGSLLQSFFLRVQKREPLAVPRGTRRFFISLRESGELCLLAAALAPDRHLLVPRLDPAKDLVDLEAVAERFLDRHGWKARRYDDEAGARRALESDLERGAYPLYVSPLDTSGEKPFEEFVGAGERTVEVGLRSLLGIAQPMTPPASLDRFLRQLEGWIGRPQSPVRKEDIVGAVAEIVPELRHRETGKTLDQRM